ncbi:serine/threonine protein kinase [Hyalangium versicolor]|uniref:serine/threonine protein kinase n=1 Tax=Hyalangium versicolor TaxID=2861190 RepID=UPI001CCE621F|nr:serine/threonine-protein kinase [Hyalangium versicolor]
MSEDDKTYLSGDRQAESKPGAPLQIVPGTVLKGTYRIDAELGSGGMGTVFRATHIGLEKTMAVKVLSHRAISTPDSLARFEREAKVAGKVSHPAMTAVIDFGVEQGTPYIVMEYVSGAELAELIERSGPMSPRRAVAVMRQIVSLLRAAHGLGIVHRDLKPANIKIIQETPEESQIFVKVLDFGVAKIVGDVSGQLTSEGMLVGTPAYMAPEQITGHPIDGRTDLYAAGLIFHEMLSGVRAFKGETIARILHAQMNDPPPPLTVQVPDIVRQTIQKFVEKRPEDRFQDAAEADRALMACEDVLRPPSVNVAAAAVLSGSTEQPSTPDAGMKTLAYRPQKAEPAAVESRPSSGVAVSDSLVREGRTAIRDQPALVPEPAPVESKPVSSPPPALVVPPPKAVEPRKSSNSTAILVVLGIGFVFLLAGLAGAVWAWKSGRLAGLPFAPSPGGQTPPATGPGTVATRPPPQTEPPPTEPGPTAETEAQAPTAPPEGNEEIEDEPEADEGDATETAEETPPPASEPQGDSCFVSVVALESSRQRSGQFGPWLMKSVDSREQIDCASVKPEKLKRQYQDLFKKWPESSSEKVLQTQTLSFEPRKKGDPNTQRVVVKVHTRVSGTAP